jgi:hypothetical protein
MMRSERQALLLEALQSHPRWKAANQEQRVFVANHGLAKQWIAGQLPASVTMDSVLTSLVEAFESLQGVGPLLPFFTGLRL